MLLDAAGAPVGRFDEGVRDGVPMADLFDREPGVSADRAVAGRARATCRGMADRRRRGARPRAARRGRHDAAPRAPVLVRLPAPAGHLGGAAGHPAHRHRPPRRRSRAGARRRLPARSSRSRVRPRGPRGGAARRHLRRASTARCSPAAAWRSRTTARSQARSSSGRSPATRRATGRGSSTSSATRRTAASAAHCSQRALALATVDALGLIVTEGNDAARRLYEALGFDLVSTAIVVQT